MKTFYLISTLLSTAASARTGNFFVADRGTLNPISPHNLFSHEGLILKDDSPSVPPRLYNLADNGHMTTESPDNYNLLGNTNGFFVFGRPDMYSPMIIQLDSDLRISNLVTYLCKLGSSDRHRYLTSRDMSSGQISCSRANVYFLAPWEAWIRAREHRERYAPRQLADDADDI